MVKITETFVDGIIILAISGHLLNSSDGQALTELIRGAVKINTQKIILDLTGLERINSIGLGIIIYCHTEMNNNDGWLKLAGLQENIRDALRFTKMESIFDI